VAVGADSRYQLTPARARESWTARTRVAMVASPSNPTGTMVEPEEIAALAALARERGATLLVDEIYHGLTYGRDARTALEAGDDVFVINSFSKYFQMTGWRLGWMVVPDALVPVIERLAQNLFICPSTIAQHAALACFEPESIALYEQRRTEFKARRDYFIPELNAMGLTVPVMPDGAFYAWADCSAACAKLGVKDSWDFAFAVMNRAHVAVTPGRDFGTAQTASFVRFSTASSLEQLQIAVARLRQLLL
jgi:aspartate/methionine/tyrosine aminotransferase